MPDKLPNGWVKTTLGEVCVLNPGRSTGQLPPEHTEVSFVPMSAVEEETGRLDASEVRTIGSIRRGYTSFQEGDVIFAKITPCMENGKIALAVGLKNGLAYGSTEFVVIRPHDGVLPRYVLHYLLQPALREDAERHMSGAAGQKRVPINYLTTHEFLLPPTAEQVRIVAKLDEALHRVERAVSAIVRAEQRIQRYRAAVLHAAVNGELTQAWRRRRQHKRANEPTSETILQSLLATRRSRWEQAAFLRQKAAGKKVKNDNWKARYPEPTPPNTDDLPALPEGWVWTSLDQLTFHLASGSRDWSQYYDRGNGTFLLAQNIRRFGLDLSFRQVVGPPANHPDRARSQVAINDLLVTIVGANTGDVCRVSKEMPETFVCQSVALIRLAERSLSHFVWLYLVSDEDGQKQWRKMIYGAGRPHLRFDHLRSTAIPIPPLAEQAQIVREAERRLAAADRLLASLEQQLTRARAMRRSLMGEAFSGRLALQDPSDESALELIKNIRVIREAEGQNRRLKPMAKFKSKSKKPRSALIDLLRQNKEPITPEQLFRQSGFEASQVDLFYRELASLRSNLVEVKPPPSDAKLWPQRAKVLLQLKKGSKV